MLRANTDATAAVMSVSSGPKEPRWYAIRTAGRASPNTAAAASMAAVMVALTADPTSASNSSSLPSAASLARNGIGGDPSGLGDHAYRDHAQLAPGDQGGYPTDPGELAKHPDELLVEGRHRLAEHQGEGEQQVLPERGVRATPLGVASGDRPVMPPTTGGRSCRRSPRRAHPRRNPRATGCPSPRSPHHRR